MEEEKTGAFIVLSDTHLGLRSWKRFHFFENTVSHRPTHVNQFLKWLEKLQIKGEIELPVVTKELDEEYEISAKRLLFPDILVLNGDIFELWDASDESIHFASHSVLNSISKLRCEKLYLIGNHDFSNASFAEKGNVKNKKDIISNIYPWGLSDIKFISDTHLLTVGEDHYLVLHGHQFDKFFGIGSWKILSYIRDGAEAFRLYSWFLVILFGVSLPWFIVTTHIENSSPFQYEKLLPVVILGVLAFPRIFISIGRPIWNHFFGSRYERRNTLKKFVRWWRKFRLLLPPLGKRIHIIYGHTHAIDMVDKGELTETVNETIEGQDLILINHPSWTKDTNQVTELREVFVYVDKHGFEFFGWNWDIKLPFHIPKSVVRNYALGYKINKNKVNSLNKLNWPEELIKELLKNGSRSHR